MLRIFFPIVFNAYYSFRSVHSTSLSVHACKQCNIIIAYCGSLRLRSSHSCYNNISPHVFPLAAARLCMHYALILCNSHEEYDSLTSNSL